MKTIQKQVDEYLNYCRYVRNMTDQTMQSKEYVFSKFIKETSISDFKELTNKRLNEWVEYQLKSGVGGRTINTRVSHVVAFSKYLRDMDYEVTLRYTLIQKVKEDPPRRLHYTREQIEHVKSHAHTMEWLLIAMKFDSGLRLSELTNLRVVNINGHKLTFLGKGRKDRKSFISDETLERLEQWIEDNQIEDYLWPSPLFKDGRPYSTDEIRHIMHRAFKRVGFDEFYPHSMRHSFGTDLERNGAPITATQRLMGHSSPDTTQKYLHGFDNKLEEIYGKYKPSMKAGTIAA
jgi:integrase/recombinase XerC